MHYARTMGTAVCVAALLTGACNKSEPAREPARKEPTAAEAAAAEVQRKRTDEGVALEKRIGDLERRWTETESAIAAKSAAATAPMRAEIREDIKNARRAVDELKTTTPANWWERHEKVMERTANDIEEDVRRLAKVKRSAVAAPNTDVPATASPFESRRDRFVARLRARVDAMEKQLKGVRARDARKTELEDTRARLGKLKEDVDKLGNASADDWWDLSADRVRDYIARVDDSIGRLDKR